MKEKVAIGTVGFLVGTCFGFFACRYYTNKYKPEPEPIINGYKVFLPSSDKIVQAWSRDDIQNQITYMEMCLSAVEKTVEKINKKEIKDLWNLFLFLADKRSKIAEALNQPDKTELGKLRTESDPDRETPLDDAKINKANARYSDQFETLKARFKNFHNAVGNTRQAICRDDDNSQSIDIIYPGHDNVDDGSEYNYISRICLSNPNSENESLEIHHTHIGNDWFIMAKIQELSSKYNFFDKENGKNTDKLYLELGKLAWYLAHFMPCKRGTAAITDMLVKSLLKYHGKELYPFKEGINWDLDAIFTSNIHDFANNYFNLFARNELKEFSDRYSKLVDKKFQSQAKTNTTGLTLP